MVLEGHSSGYNMAQLLDRNDNGDVIVRIGHSPDPDDAFMFHAMTNNKFPTPGYHFVHELQDIETLNHRAMNQELEVSAVSIHAFPDIAEHYSLMNCGASMGEGYGPMIVAKSGVTVEQAKNSTIAVPGLKTSAYLGLRLAWGDVTVEVVPFDEIIPVYSPNTSYFSILFSANKPNSPFNICFSSSINFIFTFLINGFFGIPFL